MKVCLKVPLSEIECARRNALSEKPPGLVLQEGMEGALVEISDKGESYMAEFIHEETGQCQWLGLLRRSEIEVLPDIAQAA
ncbi:MAG: hypothetical protein AB7E81_03585 [Hyphomicrobiaceae bacterium]